MLEEFKKTILRGSLSSRIIINNFSSISYKKCRRLARGIWLFVGGWKLISNFFSRMQGSFCNMHYHVTISAWRRQVVWLFKSDHKFTNNKTKWLLYISFLPFFLFIFPFLFFLSVHSVLLITISFFYFFPMKKGTMLNF